MGVARLRSQQSRAPRTAMGRRGQNTAGLGLHTSAARLRASRPRGPRADHAVARARLLVAGLRFGQGGAHDTAIGRLHRDGPGARLAAAVAGGRARRPRRPGTDHAIDGAGRRVACLRGHGLGAARGLAICFMAIRACHRTGLDATAARLGAHGPGARVPVRARLCLARLGLRQDGARDAAIGRGHSDRASRRLLAATALGRAHRPRGPATHYAVARARVRVARLTLGQGWACDTAVGGRHQHGSRLRPNTATARP